jgi:hypothetical protein
LPGTTWPPSLGTDEVLRRLGLAALVGNPRLLILDEPTSALDPAGRAEILAACGRDAGRRTVIFSGHVLADVQRVADHGGGVAHGGLPACSGRWRLSARAACRVGRARLVPRYGNRSGGQMTSSTYTNVSLLGNRADAAVADDEHPRQGHNGAAIIGVRGRPAAGSGKPATLWPPPETANVCPCRWSAPPTGSLVGFVALHGLGHAGTSRGSRDAEADSELRVGRLRLPGRRKVPLGGGQRPCKGCTSGSRLPMAPLEGGSPQRTLLSMGYDPGPSALSTQVRPGPRCRNPRQ